MIIFVSVPFLTAEGSQKLDNPLLSLPSFFGCRWQGLKLGGRRKEVAGTSIKRKPPKKFFFTNTIIRELPVGKGHCSSPSH